MSRLQTQAEEFSESNLVSLKKLEIGPNMDVVDIGCGTGSVSLVMSSLVGEEGKVTGIDFNPFAVKHCEKIVKANNISNTNFVVADATDLNIDSQTFDRAYSRFLFQHIKDPRKALGEMIRVTRPGGMIMVEDCDLFTWIVYPDNPSISKLWHWYESIQTQRGTDPQIGRKLYSMFLDQNLQPNVEVHSRALYSENTPFWASIVAVLSAINNVDLKLLIRGIKEFSKSPNSLFIFPLVFRVWAKVK
jgi:ubiquinone/menaquinone biosynthesis C-methylase UbiE